MFYMGEIIMSNVMPASIRCAHAGVTTGEWADCLRQVFDDVLGVLEADRQPDESGADAQGLALIFGVLFATGKLLLDASESWIWLLVAVAGALSVAWSLRSRAAVE